jgi:hypothetical protein
MKPQLDHLVDTLLNVSVFVFVSILVWLFLKKDSQRKNRVWWAT